MIAKGFGPQFCIVLGCILFVLGMGPCSASNSGPSPIDSVWVMQPDGGKSCSPQSGQSLEDGAKALTGAKVHVLESRKGSDGKMHMQMCGASTGTTNTYLIPKADLAQAITVGFQEASKNQ